MANITIGAVIQAIESVSGRYNVYPMSNWLYPNRVNNTETDLGRTIINGDEATYFSLTNDGNGFVRGLPVRIDPRYAYRVEIWDRSTKPIGRNYFGLYFTNEDDSFVESGQRYHVDFDRFYGPTTNLYFVTYDPTDTEWTKRVTYLVPQGEDLTKYAPYVQNMEYIIEFPAEPFDFFEVRYLNYANGEEEKTVYIADGNVERVTSDISLLTERGLSGEIASISLIDTSLDKESEISGNIVAQSEIGSRVTRDRSVSSDIDSNSDISDTDAIRSRHIDSTIESESEINDLTLYRSRDLTTDIEATSVISNLEWERTRGIKSDINAISSLRSSLNKPVQIDSQISSIGKITIKDLNVEKSTQNLVFEYMNRLYHTDLFDELDEVIQRSLIFTAQELLRDYFDPDIITPRAISLQILYMLEGEIEEFSKLKRHGVTQYSVKDVSVSFEGTDIAPNVIAMLQPKENVAKVGRLI